MRGFSELNKTEISFLLSCLVCPWQMLQDSLSVGQSVTGGTTWTRLVPRDNKLSLFSSVPSKFLSFHYVLVLWLGHLQVASTLVLFLEPTYHIWQTNIHLCSTPSLAFIRPSRLRKVSTSVLDNQNLDDGWLITDDGWRIMDDLWWMMDDG